ncbi:hypothetical protein [Streptomyces sp. OK228]|uniref:hypothetical protein n=1 Tax=Streptomyces sp. OK228 TaxID=1882786 RepID=UPI000BD3C92A|nr:hypothetical protein [Streptomyces sp. OK228]SOE32535.1 hypothetical protein SAMN05442782_9497 [Streptomyces sp. OK228]
MDDPVFVIHGVANRDQKGFTATVADLQTASGLDMVPVYWGDLGAEDRFITAALPIRPAVLPGAQKDSGLRDTHEPPSVALPEPVLAAALASHPEVPNQWPQVETAVRERLASEEQQSSSSGLRHAPLRDDPDEILEYLAEEWPKTEWLRRTDDPLLLFETSRSLAEALIDAADLWTEGAGSYDGLRAGDEGTGRLRTLVRNRLRDLDRVAGAAIQAAAGRLNNALRTRFGPGTTRFLGDVLVYQRHREAIHARVRKCIDNVDPALGRTPDRPVRVVAHSLGGVIAVDMATASTALWTSSLVTFGSQAAFFHACDPRGGQIPPYSGSQPVVLPPSLARWTNLWEPLDMLAFVAAGVFQLHDGSTPVDISVPHAASTGVWTHSSYWSLPSVASEISTAMAAQ